MKTISLALLDLLHADHNASAFVVLLDFTFTDATHLRYARWNTSVAYGGHTYTAWAFDAELLGCGKGSSVPTETLILQDPTRVLRPYAIASNWFRDTTLTVAVVCVDQLALDYAWSTVTSEILAAAPVGEALRLKLGGRNLTKMRYPPDRYWATQCPYARGFTSDPRCGYSGAETTCDGSLDDCVARSNEARWGGFLGGDEKAGRLVIPYALRRS